MAFFFGEWRGAGKRWTWLQGEHILAIPRLPLASPTPAADGLLFRNNINHNYLRKRLASHPSPHSDAAGTKSVDPDAIRDINIDIVFSISIYRLKILEWERHDDRQAQNGAGANPEA
ncbi:MAG: hypothetical protein WCT12_32525, partial [Verrucomicrobiota bacterium]